MTDDGAFPVASADEFDRHPLTAQKCYRHSWRSEHKFEKHESQPWMDDEGSYPDSWWQCVICARQDSDAPCLTACVVCGKPRDEAVRRRNRQNKNRGGAFERSIAVKLGARRTGPLGGRDDVLGETVAVQTKKTINFSVRQARTYLDDLSRTYPTRTALVIHAEPGRDREAVVILRLADWLLLHGPDGVKP